MRRAVALAVAFTFIAATSNAAIRQQCFSSADIEAVQAIEFQTQLMVASDICSDPSYRQFTQRNRDAIVRYQKQMIEHFRRNGDTKADRAFDSYITRLANQEALRSGQKPVVQVCQSAAPLIATANHFNSGDDFRHFIADQAVARRSQYAVCKD